MVISQDSYKSRWFLSFLFSATSIISLSAQFKSDHDLSDIVPSLNSEYALVYLWDWSHTQTIPYHTPHTHTYTHTHIHTHTQTYTSGVVA